MAPTTQNPENVYQMRYMRKDIGVAVVAAIGLLIGLLLFNLSNASSVAFKAEGSPFSIAYPSGWVTTESLLDQPLIKVQDPATPSGFKSTLIVDMRELDPAAPPTLQQLLDQRVEERGTLTAYHFIGNKETTVAGEKAMQYDYAYVVQPIDQPRRASTPVVVVAREYIIVTKDRTYYITLATPEAEQNRIGSKFEQIINSVRLQ